MKVMDNNELRVDILRNKIALAALTRCQAVVEERYASDLRSINKDADAQEAMRRADVKLATYKRELDAIQLELEELVARAGLVVDYGKAEDEPSRILLLRSGVPNAVIVVEEEASESGYAATALFKCTKCGALWNHGMHTCKESTDGTAPHG